MSLTTKPHLLARTNSLLGRKHLKAPIKFPEFFFFPSLPQYKSTTIYCRQALNRIFSKQLSQNAVTKLPRACFTTREIVWH